MSPIAAKNCSSSKVIGGSFLAGISAVKIRSEDKMLFASKAKLRTFKFSR